MALTTALVTGASSGIGYEISKLLAEQGHDLVLVARREDRLKQLARYLEKEFDITAHVIPVDLTDLEDIDRLYITLEQENIPVDILVNNAGLGHWGPFTANDTQKELEMIQVNVMALTYLSKLFATDMVKRGLGKILNIASISGFTPGPYMATYNASKAFVVSFSEALNAELKGTGVSVTVSCPGPAASEFHQQAGTSGSFFLKLMPMMSSGQVARASLAAMNKRKTLVVPGTINWLISVAPRVVPIRVMLFVLKHLMRPRGQH
ncbi:SDR family NAD(P)-dependent oxidoreductase [Ketobacter sp.]|uniref:SDR family NAD(P)-dependent oxidoreductase n=1 Tax=Ketobacter sp. TaxID=2083498 RepID=UPI000F11B5EC|nr:SDR family oxidoreductase [Ketobacter sp.]RLU00225.1 MAG: SDR family oxidoreductase [Ketobacter sp.]